MVTMIARTALVRSIRPSAGGGGAVPTFVAAGAGAQGTTSVSVPYYAGLAAGDIAFIFVAAPAFATVTIGAASGFSAETQIVAPSDRNNGRVFWRRLDGGESGSISVSCTGADSCVGRMIGIRGAIASGTPYEGYDSTNGETTVSAVMPSPSTVTTGVNRLGLRFYGTDEFVGGGTPPSGWDERFEYVHTTIAGLIYADTKTIAAAGTEAATNRGTTDGYVYVTAGLAVIPA